MTSHNDTARAAQVAPSITRRAMIGTLAAGAVALALPAQAAPPTPAQPKRWSDAQMLEAIRSYRGEDARLRGASVALKTIEGTARPGELEDALAPLSEGERASALAIIAKADCLPAVSDAASLVAALGPGKSMAEIRAIQAGRTA